MSYGDRAEKRKKCHALLKWPLNKATQPELTVIFLIFLLKIPNLITKYLTWLFWWMAQINGNSLWQLLSLDDDLPLSGRISSVAWKVWNDHAEICLGLVFLELVTIINFLCGKSISISIRTKAVFLNRRERPGTGISNIFKATNFRN